MSALQILSLLLALATALNLAFVAGMLAHRAGATTPQAIMAGAGAAATGLSVYFTAVAAYT